MIATMAMMIKRISRSTSTGCTETGVRCSTKSAWCILILLTKPSTCVAKAWKETRAGGLVDFEFFENTGRKSSSPSPATIIRLGSITLAWRSRRAPITSRLPKKHLKQQGCKAPRSLPNCAQRARNKQANRTNVPVAAG